MPDVRKLRVRQKSGGAGRSRTKLSNVQSHIAAAPWRVGKPNGNSGLHITHDSQRRPVPTKVWKKADYGAALPAASLPSRPCSARAHLGNFIGVGKTMPPRIATPIASFSRSVAFRHFPSDEPLHAARCRSYVRATYYDLSSAS